MESSFQWLSDHKNERGPVQEVTKLTGGDTMQLWKDFNTVKEFPEGYLDELCNGWNVDVGKVVQVA